MAATCAACMQPITSRAALVVSGTEVFHRACALNISTSRAHRQAQRVLEVERMVEIAQRGMAEVQRSCDAYVSRSEQAVAVAQAAQEAAENRAAVAQRAGRELGIALGEMRQARDAALRERDAARSEAALHQRLGSATSTTDVATVGKLPVEDDSVQRFAMLELD